MDTQKDTSITDAFLSFIEEDSLHHYDALRILEDNHFEKEDCYEIALMKCNKKAISDDLKLRLLFLMESYIKLTIWIFILLFIRIIFCCFSMTWKKN